MKSLITNIQRMCLHDGPGIRTTIFMKGCTVYCPWCSNPENISFQRENYFLSEKCKRNGNDCILNGNCPVVIEERTLKFGNSPCNAIGIYGIEFKPQDLVDELCKDEDYFNHGGGVTFSGGEALAHMGFLEEVMMLLKKKKIHIVVETALFVSPQMVELALRHVDLFYIDIKILLPDQCKEIIGGDVHQYKENVELIMRKKIPVIFRIPCSNRYTLSVGNQSEILEFIKKYKNIPVELFKLHRMGEKKYISLGKSYDTDNSCEETELQIFKNRILKQGNYAEIIQI